MFAISLAQIKTKIPLASAGHCSAQKGEHCYNARNNVINTIIFCPKHIQHDAHCVKAYEHNQDLAEIEKNCVFCYSCCIGH